MPKDYYMVNIDLKMWNYKSKTKTKKQKNKKQKGLKYNNNIHY